MKKEDWFSPENIKMAQQIIATMHDQSEHQRATAIVDHAYLDEALKEFLKTRLVYDQNLFKRHFGERGLTFESRIDLCYLLGLINANTRLALKKIGEIRNRFAHKTKLINFFDNDIKEKCKDLHLYLIKHLKDHSFKEIDFKKDLNNPLEMFQQATRMLNIFLVINIRNCKKIGLYEHLKT